MFPRSTKTGKTVNVGDFPTVEQAQAAMLSHYKVTPKRGDFRYRIFEEELEEINGVTFRKTARSVNIVEVLNMKTCKICGCSFDEENFEGVVVNEGIDNEYHVCCDCVPSECNNGHIISCEACGSYFSADKLHDEEIEGHSFTACPACGKDVVEGLSRAEFEDEYFCPRYSVVVRQFSGSVRGYIVSANSRHEVMKRLLEKLDFNYVAEVSIGEILVKEDEF